MFANTRNKIYSFYKNFETLSLIFVLFKHYLSLGIYIIIAMLQRDLNSTKPVFKAIFWSILNIKKLLNKRNENKFRGTEKILPKKRFSYLYYLNPNKL